MNYKSVRVTSRGVKRSLRKSSNRELTFSRTVSVVGKLFKLSERRIQRCKGGYGALRVNKLFKGNIV